MNLTRFTSINDHQVSLDDKSQQTWMMDVSLFFRDWMRVEMELSMVKKILAIVLFWLVIFVAAFVVPRLIEPIGSGFTRGTNRLPLLLGLQCFGFIVALVSAGFTYKNRAKITKWMVVAGFAPLSIDVIFVVLMVLFYGGSIIIGMLTRQRY